MRIIESLKKLGLKINGVEPQGETVDTVIDEISESYNVGSDVVTNYVVDLRGKMNVTNLIETKGETTISDEETISVLDKISSDFANHRFNYNVVVRYWPTDSYGSGEQLCSTITHQMTDVHDTWVGCFYYVSITNALVEMRLEVDNDGNALVKYQNVYVADVS